MSPIKALTSFILFGVGNKEIALKLFSNGFIPMFDTECLSNYIFELKKLHLFVFNFSLFSSSLLNISFILVRAFSKL